MVELDGDFETPPPKKSFNFSVQRRGGVLLVLRGWDLGGPCVGVNGRSHRARMGNPVSLSLATSWSWEKWWPQFMDSHPVLWGFRFLRGCEFCEIYLTMAEVQHFPSSPLHLGDFIFLVTKSFRADWPHSDIFGMRFFLK